MEKLSTRQQGLIMSGVNLEIRNRIRLSVAAYAYEYKDDPIMSDNEFDSLARSIDVTKKTGHKKLDKFFKTHFMPDTGMWIRNHPDLSGIKFIYEKYYIKLL